MDTKRTKKYLTGLSALFLVFNSMSTFGLATAAPVKSTKLSTSAVTVKVGTIKSVSVKGIEGATIRVKIGTAQKASCVIGESGECSVSGSYLLDAGGSINVTIDESGSAKIESDPLAITYKTSLSTALTAANIASAINNFNGSGSGASLDEINFKSLTNGTKLVIYSAKTGGNVVASGTASGTTMKLEGKLLTTAVGSLFISKIDPNMKEATTRFEQKMLSDDSLAITSTNVSGSINNAPGESDRIGLKKLKANSLVAAYNSVTNGAVVAEGLVDASGRVILSGILTSGSLGSVYVSVTEPKKRESKRFAVKFTTDVTPLPSLVTSADNGVDYDVVKLTNKVDFTLGTTFRLYSSATSKDLLVTQSIPLSLPSGIGSGAPDYDTKQFVVIDNSHGSGVPLFDDRKTGTVFLSIQLPKKRESDKRISVKFGNAFSTPLKSSQIKLTNTFDGMPYEGVTYMEGVDSIEVTGITGADSVIIYPQDPKVDSGSIGSTSCMLDSGETCTATVSGNAILHDYNKSVYLTKWTENKLQSPAVKVSYPVTESTAVNAKNIFTFNDDDRLGDRIRVRGLKEGSLVMLFRVSGKIYDFDRLIQVPNGQTTIRFMNPVSGTGSFMKSAGGEFQLAIVEPGKFMSKYTKVIYPAE